jgi:outer membrane protein assembly factor BamA
MDATGIFLRYSYGRLWNSLYLDLSRSVFPRVGGRVNGVNRAYDEETLSATLGTALPILRDVARTATLSFSYSFNYWRERSPRPIPLPDDISPSPPELGRYATLNVGLSYNDSRRFLFSVGPESGRYGFVSASFAHPALGSEYTVYAIRASISQYIGIPWPWRWAKNHTLLLTYEGGISGGSLRRRGLFYIGGFPASEDYLRAALFGQRPGNPKLRGYEAGQFYGDQMHAINLEYRFPILWLERGYETLPIYLWRLHGAVYSDIGTAFYGSLSLDKFKVSVGGELRLDGTLGYYLPFALQLGYAHGFMEGADSRVYFLINNPF